jgi:hypothetical protein
MRMKLEYWENEGQVKHLENLAVNNFFDRSDSELVGNEIIDYCFKSNLKYIGRYDKMKAALKAIERCEGSFDYYIEGFANFREMVNCYN